MTHAPTRTCFALEAWHGTVAIAENRPLARDTFLVEFACPQIAARILPGQFVMIRLPGCNDPLLGRALALYNTALDRSGESVGLEFVYLVVGKLTGRLARMTMGQELEVWGPLGNGFSPQPCDHLVMVAGGIGQTPFLALAAEYLGRRRYGKPWRAVPAVPAAPAATLCYGTRSGDLLAGVEDFQRLGAQVRVATEDGSAGHQGLVTELLTEVLGESRGRCHIVCCGPEPMMAAVARIAARAQISCHVSLETPMACGLGICFSCVTRVRQRRGGWDYRRTCVEGPVFDAAEIVW